MSEPVGLSNRIPLGSLSHDHPQKCVLAPFTELNSDFENGVKTDRIAGMFSQGDFQLPMLIHGTVPPGVDTMRRLKNEITYVAEITQKGARVRIRTENSDALQAIHEFLPFSDHRSSNERFHRSTTIAATPRRPGSSFQVASSGSRPVIARQKSSKRH
jgi:hypothetical protein